MAFIVEGFDLDNFWDESDGRGREVFKSESVNEGFVGFSDDFKDWWGDGKMVVGGVGGGRKKKKDKE